MPMFPATRWPWVSRARYEDKGERLRATVRELSEAEEGITALNARIAELEAPEAVVARDIAVAEGQIVLAELEIKLRRLKEDPDPVDARPSRPDPERVMEIAAAHRRAKVLALVK